MANGGIPRGPETITFDPPVDRVTIHAGHMQSGLITMECFDEDDNSIGVDSIVGHSALAPLSVSAFGIERCVLSFTGALAVFDDLSWTYPQCFVLDFETGDEGQPLVHGQHLGDGDGEFDGGSSFPVTITSSVIPSGMSTAAILNSSTGPAAQDPDLLVGTGNILILQTEANMSECPPGSGVYCTHNDDEDGGRLTFAFTEPVIPRSLVLIDIDASDGTSSIALTDSAGARRTYSVPAAWTGDLVVDGPPGLGTLDLSTLADQPGHGSTATASEDAGYDPLDVVQIDVHLDGSGGLDDLSWCRVLPMASFLARNGSGTNRVVLSNASMPLVGGTWAANLDCRDFGNGVATLYVSTRPTSGTMTPLGERLIAGDLLRRTSQIVTGSVSQFSWNIPVDPALIGLDLYAQGSCQSATPSFAPKLLRAQGGLSNALDLILGY